MASTTQESARDQKDIDRELADSFPASDPPSFTPVTGPGEPDHGDEAPPAGQQKPGGQERKSPDRAG